MPPKNRDFLKYIARQKLEALLHGATDNKAVPSAVVGKLTLFAVKCINYPIEP